MHVVVIGAGLAGANAVAELRERGHTGEITLLGAEAHPPYERPPLSKGVLLGSAEPDSTLVHEPQWYADHQVDLRTSTPATGIDLDRRRVTAGGEQIAYDRLLLATGSAPRHLPQLDGTGLDVRYLRTLDDATALKPRLTGEVLIVGAGWIGLEVAAAAREAGARVTVVEASALPLLGVLGPGLGKLFAELHRDHGVDLRLGTTLEPASDDAGPAGVLLSDGHRLTPDVVVVGIGAVPSDQLAREAGLAVDGGVLVDPALRSEDPRVFAAGDVALHDHPVLGRRIRVEHWDTAIHQGRAAARSMLGDDAPYERMPYFFTDQYDLGMEYVGSPTPGVRSDIVVRGDRSALTAFWLEGSRVVAGMHVNDWDAIDTIRSLVGRDAPEGLRDESRPLAEVAAAV